VPLAGGRRPPSQKLVPSPSVDPEDPFTAAQYEELEHQALIYKFRGFIIGLAQVTLAPAILSAYENSSVRIRSPFPLRCLDRRA
jgi:hypothetical protein